MPLIQSHIKPGSPEFKANAEHQRALVDTLPLAPAGENSVTTIAGLIPLMFETSRQAQSLIPVATSIVFGITASTVLVLVVLPATYAALGDLG